MAQLYIGAVYSNIELVDVMLRQVAAGALAAQCRSRATTTGWSCSERAASVRARSCCASFAGLFGTRTCRRSKTPIGRSSAVINRFAYHYRPNAVLFLLLCVKLSLRQKRQRDTSVCLFVLYVSQGRPSYGGGNEAFSKFKGIKIRDQPIHEILSVDYHENL